MHLRIFYCVALAAALAGIAHGQTWDGGGSNNNWTDANNWNPNALPQSNGTATLNFAGSTRLNSVLDGVVFDAGGITFDNNAGAFVIQGSGQLTIRGGGIANHNLGATQSITLGVNLGANQTWGGGPLIVSGNIATGAYTLTIGGPAVALSGTMSGTGHIEKTGDGFLQLAGNSTFSGGITMNQGSLEVAHNSALGTGTFTIAGGFIQAGSAPRTLANAIAITNDFQIGGNQGLVFSGPITVTGAQKLTNGIGVLAITGAIGEDVSGRELELAGNGTLTLAGAALTLGTSLKHTSGTLTAAGLINTPGRTLTQSGGTFTGSLINRGTFNYHGGTHSGNLTNESSGQANFNANLTVTAALDNQGTLRVASGRTLAFGSQHLISSGTIELAGGTLSANASTQFGSSGVVSGFGTISTTGSSFNNTGQINVSGGNLTLTSNVAQGNSGTIHVPQVRQFIWNSTANYGNSGLVSLSGGTLAGTGPVTNHSTGQIRGHGTIQATLTNNRGLIRATGGTLTVANLAGHNISGGELRVDDEAALNLNTAFESSGTIVLAGDNATFNAMSVVNTGTVRGKGRIIGTVLNSGVVRAEDGTLTFVSAENTNTSAGRLEAPAGGQLLFTRGLATNAGVIALTGGAFDNNNVALDNTGRIEGFGTLRSTGQITNTGAISVVNSLDVLGPVTNNGTVSTATGGVTRFFGPVTGPGSYTGTGTVAFLNTVSPGASPAKVTFGGNVLLETATNLTIELAGTTIGSQYDTLEAAGALSIGGALDLNLLGEFAPQPGSVFQIASAAGGISGKFSTASLPTLVDSSWQLVYQPNAVLLRVALRGDFNFDGTVSAADYTLWRDHAGQSGAALLADADGDGSVDQDDFVLWKSQFGVSYGSGSGSAISRPGEQTVIPEPAPIILLFSLLLSGFAFGTRRLAAAQRRDYLPCIERPVASAN